MSGSTLQKRRTRTAEILLLIISIGGITYVLDQIAGASVFSSSHTVTVELPSGGGIYPAANVTYRGGTVGKVTDVRLVDGGVHATLEIDGDVDIPVDTEAAVSNLSAIGEQRIDFRPRTDAGPYLRDGAVVAAADTVVPRRFDDLVTHLGDVADRIDADDLTTITTELGTGLDTDTDLVTLGSNADTVLTMVEKLQPRVSQLMKTSQVPLRGIVDTGDDLRSFARDLELITDEMAREDDTLRGALDATTDLTPGLSKAIADLTAPLTSAVAAWNQFARLGDDRLPGYEHWLTYAPSQFFAMSEATRDGSGHVLLAANFGPNCAYGDPRMSPFSVVRQPAPYDNRCTTEAPDVQQRGAQYAPRLPGDPAP